MSVLDSIGEAAKTIYGDAVEVYKEQQRTRFGSNASTVPSKPPDTPPARTVAQPAKTVGQVFADLPEWARWLLIGSGALFVGAVVWRAVK